jgi:hypothetical protein
VLTSAVENPHPREHKQDDPGVLETYASLDAVFTYKIKRNAVGIMMKKDTAARPRMLISINEKRKEPI